MTTTLGFLGALAAATPPAKGTSTSEVISASIVAFIAVIAVVALGWSHRTRGTLKPLVGLIEERTGLPAWSGVPVAITGGALLIAVFGYYWDVSWHIDRGRDPGAFANPAHWFIIIGLDGIAFAGLLAVILGDRKHATSVRITRNWYAPVGGILLALCGVVALAGFPLDDIWHRLFGQDVTAWGPTHIQMIGGASLATLGAWALLTEGLRHPVGPIPKWLSRTARLQDIALAGAFLIGLSTLQVEFDFGVPQFRSLYHPILIMLAAGIGLVAARLRAGRGAAIGAAVMFIAVRGALSIAIDPILGRSLMHFPLYIVEALLVEAVAMFRSTERQIDFGLWCGVAIGTIGLAAEWAWSHMWMPYPWHADLLPEAAILGFLAAVAGGVIGGLIGRSLAPDGVARQHAPRVIVAGAWIVALACLAIPLPVKANTDWHAKVELTPAAGVERNAFVTLTMTPASAGKHTDMFQVLAWQGRKSGKGGLVMAPFHQIADGVYRTNQAVPLAGTWKTMVVLHRGNSLQDIALYLPEDKAIPAAGVLAATGSTHRFVREKSVLQREATGGDVNLQRAAYGVLGLIAFGWIAAMGWGLGRLGGEADPPATDRRRRRAERIVGAAIQPGA